MSFKEQLTPKKIPNKEDIDHLAEEIKSDVEAVFAPLQEEDVKWYVGNDSLATRYDLREDLTNRVMVGINKHLNNDALLVEDYQDILTSVEVGIAKVIHSDEFSEKISRELAKQTLYRGNEELLELERSVVDITAYHDLDDDHAKFIAAIDDFLSDLPPEKSAFAEAIARDYGYITLNELRDWYREQNYEYDEHSLED